MTDNKRKYKLTFHFENHNDFLDGFFVVVEAQDSISALRNFLDYDHWITEWENKTVCVNIRKFTYVECEEVKEDDR